MQAELVLWLRNVAVKQWPILAWVFHCPNGGARNPVVAGQMVALGVKKGVPDLLLPRHVRAVDNLRTFFGCAVECKTDNGRLTPEQIAWLTMLSNDGWQTHVVRSVEDGKSVFANYAQGMVCTTTRWEPCTNDESFEAADTKPRPRRRRAA